jgi:hypothetical protein
MMGEFLQLAIRDVIRINQLPVSATRWQHWSWDIFFNFNLIKTQKIVNNLMTIEASE